MNIYKSFDELAKGINKPIWEVIKAWDIWIGRDYMLVGDIEVRKHIRNEELHYIVFDENNNDECKKYIMEYEKDEYDWKVYVDGIEGWQNCKVVDIENTGEDINRATVVCESGTQLNRIVKYALDEDELIADRCIYFYDKED